MIGAINILKREITIMMTLKRFTSNLDVVPMGASWLLSDLGECHGKQELFTKQSPQRFRASLGTSICATLWIGEI
jgi:hypothetical protein